ncbi:30S ribosomal protein S5 [Methanocella sp. CWC-04]|uniref:Small ribosomal subunit protein uS5 n=1 Tax=Methanooceanicella nereidis TaxID=2052831 RepID=A0AAP2R9K7_9EURY|nr:30S ribosomal protein S5 [Methanocella sp. CWC-04]MCD1293493.1 30S ribosomal protein S5 [Methanocella sp. CWC-04]
MVYEQEVAWVPKTRLGKLVAEGKIKTIEEAFDTGLPIKEPEIVDALIPDLVDEVLDIKMVQRMTDSGRRVKFRTTVVIGNGNGYVGLAEGKDVQVGPAIRKAIEMAKLNIINVKRGCGSWECGCGLSHTVPSKVEGKAGSLTVTLIPAPRGLGIAAGGPAKKVLEMAGYKDVWSRTEGETRTTINYALATYRALEKTNTIRTKKEAE